MVKKKKDKESDPHKGKVGRPVKLTSKDRCTVYRRQRDKYYKQRTAILKSLSASGLKDSQKRVLDNKYKRINKHIDEISAKMFRCTKQYSRLRKEKDALQRRVRGIVKELKQNRDMSKTEKNKLYTEMVNISSDIRSIKQLMKMPLVEQKRGVVGLVEVPDRDMLFETIVVWEARSRIEQLITGTEFTTLSVGDELISLEFDKLGALYAIDDFIAEIAASQSSSKVTTPELSIMVDFTNKSITVSRV